MIPLIVNVVAFLLVVTASFAGVSALLRWRQRRVDRKRWVQWNDARYRPLPQTEPGVYPYQRVVKAQAAEDIPAGVTVSIPSRTHEDDYTAGYYGLLSMTMAEDTGPTREVLPFSPPGPSPSYVSEAYSPSCDYAPAGDTCSSFDGGGSPGSDSSW